MIRSRRRLFLTVFLVVFLGGLGVSGASALWSMQTRVSTEVIAGTWGPSPTPTTGTPSTNPPSQSWNPCLRATVLHKNNPVSIRLEWAAPAGYTVHRVEVHDGKNGQRTVELSADRRSAQLSLPNGTADYRLVLGAVTDSGQSQDLERTLSFQPSGQDGEVSISPNACG